ncbi:hypothetical protein A3F00_00450 [Candidatus Daviesbacteria bacterium RIFCSPHIGHO2_12_FULL_37_11]|uniref:Uncharacterized protein n=1 Tax=Candidatus Daviesbacteria bacterium RIFCSPHIGHO2_12_FULL_37_11 TaxID=1797777 RepID=A0A1F5KBW6_9BACT|nr:MAG: hypothetical protein A2111_02370 [Candidatus Daviesbacteria bacterium GWA1_38_6]OGE17034.1 MAG: hypothetical protein A2769_03070 [Candidatus Daviesbacteria bacterium RIFCSPHIGHO2_01_FULL_37_27]OGE38442.1 MAG: hypothetical protein A3F00_00450 [Candidatus Daviesbacteria bacterium RIFCSPHIGHO2_12_FULL_37_11]OGE45987.1 MAG: hypothetical protein A3B39_04255 [Candidatus Daviesbacteria bacterium RIFCSPLOWO2_01_FULL_37_10]
MRLISSNVILNFLTRGEGADKCLALFKKLSLDGTEAITTEAVIVKVINILSGDKFELSPEEIRGKMTPILALEGLRLRHKRRILLALDIWVKYKVLDFTDALVVAYMKRDEINEIYSYDKDFDQLPQIKRIEP